MAVVSDHESVVARVIDNIEQHLLDKHNRWVEIAVRHLRYLLRSDRRERTVRSDLRDWLGLAGDGKNRSFSKAATTYLLATAAPHDPTSFFGSVSAELSDDGRITDTFLTSLVVAGLQYVVLHYNANHREFRGAYLRSNLLSRKQLEPVKASLRVPYRRGAVNWMTSVLDSSVSDAVVTLHDAALDIRGRVAAEDLVFGNYSVCGFPLFDERTHSLTGFFFASHPVPGLFAGVPEFVSIFSEVRQKLAVDLGRAVEEDVITEFGAATLKQSEAWNERAYVKSLGSAPIMSLADESPTGFLAGLRITRDRNPVEGVVAQSVVDCHISETPFINLVWWHLQLTSTFHELWSDQNPRHLHAFANLLEPTKFLFRRMAWVPEDRSTPDIEATLPGADRMRGYYPAGVVDELNKSMSNEGTGWLEWHVREMRAAKINARTGTAFHEQIHAALRIYSGPSHADLVVPIFGRAGIVMPRVVGFLRFNCDPPTRSELPGHTSVKRFHHLYEILQASLPGLDSGLGNLLSWTDSALQGLPQAPLSIRRFKQLIDAARTVSDWTVAYLTDALAGKSHDSRVAFDIVRLVYSHLENAVAEPNGLGRQSLRLATILDETYNGVKALGDALQTRVEVLPDIPIITLWLQSARPVIDVVNPDESKLNSFAELLKRDPGLPQLLSYLSFAFSDHEKLALPLNLQSRLWIYETSAGHWEAQPAVPPADADYVIDLGVPPFDAKFTLFEVTGMSRTDDGTTLSLLWKFDDDVRENPESITLRWNWGGQMYWPFPASIQHIPWKVSRRIGAVIAENAQVSLSKDLHDLAGELIEVVHAFDSLSSEMDMNLRLLESAMQGPEPHVCDRKRWRTVAVAEHEYLLMLVGSATATPIVSAFRDIALAYERGAHIAWIRGKEHYARETLAEQLAAVSHGYTGPVGALRHELTMTKTRWGAESSLPPDVVLRAMADFIGQASAIIRLGEAAIEFAKFSEQHVRQRTPVTGKEVFDYVDQVIKAYQPREGRSIDLRPPDGSQLARKTVHLDADLFIHGLSKLLDNAVKAARAAPVSGPFSEPRTQIDLDVVPAGLRLTLSNVSAAPSTAVVERIHRGLVRGEPDEATNNSRRGGLGLREAWKCFQRVGIVAEVRPGNTPFTVAVELLIPFA